MPAGRLPAAFDALPGDANFAAVKKQIPGRMFTAQDAPTIFVSTVPAAIIVTAGAPQFVAIPGTSLQYVANSDAALFRDRTGTYYYLVSGRWFSAAEPRRTVDVRDAEPAARLRAHSAERSARLRAGVGAGHAAGAGSDHPVADSAAGHAESHQAKLEWSTRARRSSCRFPARRCSTRPIPRST